MNNLLIVESPAKAKTINKYLGEKYNVMASYGHVRDLPSKNGSVLPNEDFTMKWESEPNAQKKIKEITQALKNADKLILATDPDREGEAISWHIYEILKQKNLLKQKTVERVAFSEITKNAIQNALKNPRNIDQNLVEAYLARRILDYLVGFTLSPILWRKLPGARSAGRVQSVALRLICERELDINIFEKQEYWDIEAQLKTKKNQNIDAKVSHINGEKLDKFHIQNQKQAEDIQRNIENAHFKISDIKKQPYKRNPYPPFITSTLQQSASRKLHFTPKQTMQIAQQLYEDGHITYMRTDGVQLAPQAITNIRNTIKQQCGQKFLPEKPIIYKTKAKNAQEAHEAIRPTNPNIVPDDISAGKINHNLNPQQLKLYKLIWERTIASQMKSAQMERTQLSIITENAQDKKIYTLTANGNIILFEGFLKIYQDEQEDSKNQTIPIPEDIQHNDPLLCQNIKPTQHFTQPPPRYSEASLIKKMEEIGIGRPSTYASIIAVLNDREYVKSEKQKLIPQDKGMLVTTFLKNFFEKYVQYDFTANLEENLDHISAGQLKWKEMLEKFWQDFHAKTKETQNLTTTHIIDTLNQALKDHIFPKNDNHNIDRQCPKCQDGNLSLKISKFGAFIGCEKYPECTYTQPFSTQNDKTKNNQNNQQDNIIGIHPETQKEILVLNGRFGPYIETENQNPEEKPKRVSIPKMINPESITLETALKLLNLPRTIGTHPEDKKPIIAGIGRYGPYIKHNTTFANLEMPQDIFDIGLNRAIDLIEEKKKKTKKITALKELGEYPEKGGEIKVFNGRYGPYVKYKNINATIPKHIEPENITLEQAVSLIENKNAKKKKTKTKK